MGYCIRLTVTNMRGYALLNPEEHGVSEGLCTGVIFWVVSKVTVVSILVVDSFEIVFQAVQVAIFQLV